MFNACANCGRSHDGQMLDPSGAFLVCPLCGDRRPFRRLPLLLVGGPAGAGKSTTGAALVGHIPEVVILETDILWRREFYAQADAGYPDYFTLWLRLAAHIGQAGRPAALFGAGFAVPHSVEPLAARKFFSTVHYLGLVCADEQLTARLSQRPKWQRAPAHAKLIAEHVKFNRWLKEHAETTAPPDRHDGYGRRRDRRPGRRLDTRASDRSAVCKPRGRKASVKGRASMFTFQHLKALLLFAASLLALQANAAAQSGRRPSRLAPTPAPTPAPEPINTTNFEQVKLLVARGLDDFVKDLNEQGRLGYRVEKSVSYGNKDERRKYAAVLRLDPGHKYEYAHDRMPDNVLYGHPLNYHARRGYNLVESYAVTQCPPVNYAADSSDQTNPDNWPIMKMLNTVKSSVFLFMRRDGAAEQTRDYKLATGQVGSGENLQETVQAAIDKAPPGFRPIRLLFTGSGLILGGVSIVLERDMNERAPAKVEYQVVKERKDLVKEINQLAADGARYVGGGRIAAFKVALLARRPAGSSDYTFLDDNKSAQEFDRLIAAGYSYQGMMGGNLNCESEEVASQKLVFAREAAGPIRQYKLLSLPEPQPGKPAAAALSELQRLAGEGFQIRDIFYAYGLHVILEKQTEARASSVQPGAR